MTSELLHVRYVYRGFDVPFDRLGVKPAADDGRIKQAVARYLTVPIAWLNEFVVERHRDGNVTLRLTSYDQ